MLSQTIIGDVTKSGLMVSEEDLRKISYTLGGKEGDYDYSSFGIGECVLITSAIDTNHGCLHESDMHHLSKMLIGTPLIIGGHKDPLNLVRIFETEIEREDDLFCIIARFFYPLRQPYLKLNYEKLIKGMSNSSSIWIEYENSICSICGEDIRNCEHWPGRDYENGICFFWYKGITRVNGWKVTNVKKTQ